jgi:excisionase family DNA binding protein
VSARALRPTELTPEARIDRAKRLLVEAVGEMVDAQIAKGVSGTEWIDQATSPLGRRRHLRLVRQGVLRGVREGRRVLVRRKDIDAYLATKTVTPAEGGDGVDAMIEAITKGATE